MVRVGSGSVMCFCLSPSVFIGGSGISRAQNLASIRLLRQPPPPPCSDPFPLSVPFWTAFYGSLPREGPSEVFSHVKQQVGVTRYH